MAEFRPRWSPQSDEALDAEIEAARVAAEQARHDAVLATSARFDRSARRVVVELNTGATFIFPVDRVQGLQGASDEDLALINVMPLGELLEWPRLDWHCSLPALMAGRFGSQAWLARQRQGAEQDQRLAEG